MARPAWYQLRSARGDGEQEWGALSNSLRTASLPPISLPPQLTSRFSFTPHQVTNYLATATLTATGEQAVGVLRTAQILDAAGEFRQLLQRAMVRPYRSSEHPATSGLLTSFSLLFFVSSPCSLVCSLP